MNRRLPFENTAKKSSENWAVSNGRAGMVLKKRLDEVHISTEGMSYL